MTDIISTEAGEKGIHKVHIIDFSSDYYPKQLKNLSDAPMHIYAKGNLELLKQPVEQNFSIVGTRKATAYGSQVATMFSRRLAREGFTIVSGLALGIDALAHRGCLDVGGTTIAVLGCGVNITYPLKNKLLYQQILDSNGLLISEFPPDMNPLPGFFIQRNRLIAGLSCGLLVVEGAINSGSMATAAFAAEQGKDVYAPPLPITSNLSEGPHRLLKHGAKLVTSPEDILEDYGIIVKKMKIQKRSKLSQSERKIISLLQKEPLSLEELMQQVPTLQSELFTTITMLEMKQLVEKNNEGRFQLIR